ncbi:MAG TPA: hypothetical protein VND64_01655 [Pirellulales bacterium]|nr:hypothetical protein [Pirellulales bacterium]
MTTAATKLIALLKPKRTWFQFSLKGLMVLVVVAAVASGLLKWQMVHKRRERAAVAEVAKVGGLVEYDWQLTLEADSPRAAGLRALCGDDFFSSVVLIQISTNKINDEWLAHLEPLAQLSQVSIHSKRITDAGVQYLTKFKKITLLSIGGTGITDAGLVHLKRLRRLLYLNLASTAVTDAGVAELQEALPNCRIDR